jgi:hypothetical protein
MIAEMAERRVAAALERTQQGYAVVGTDEATTAR